MIQITSMNANSVGFIANTVRNEEELIKFISLMARDRKLKATAINFAEKTRTVMANKYISRKRIQRLYQNANQIYMYGTFNGSTIVINVHLENGFNIIKVTTPDITSIRELGKRLNKLSERV